MGKILYIILFLACTLSCKSQKANSLQIIHEKIGEEAVIQYNEGQQFALVKQNIESPQANFYSTNYLILEVETNTVLQEGKVRNGYIKWIDNETVEVFENPGVIRESDKKEDFKKYIKVSQLKPKKK